MSNHSKVIWSEGLFLQPQHLQQQERYIENLILNRPNFTGFANWGLLEYELDQHLLLLGKFALTKCRGILPDGTVFDTLATDDTPLPIDIPLGTTNACVYLAVPLKRQGLAEIGLNEEDQLFCRYHIEDCEVADNIAGSENLTKMQVGKLSLRFMLENEKRGGYSCLALTKIKEILPDMQIKLDEQFIPPCLDIHIVTKLSHFSKELLSLLYHRGERLAQSQTEAGYGGVSEIIDFTLLGIVNRAEALLQFFATKRGVHPENFYLYLIELLANLAAFDPNNRRLKQIPAYIHHDLQSCFDPIIAQLRQALSFVVQHSALSLSLESRQYGMWVSHIEDRTLLEQANFVIGVHADIESTQLVAQFIAQAKVAAVETIQSLITHVLPGIDLRPMPVAPREIPLISDFIYFAINKTHEYWADLQTSAGIAIHLGTELPGLKLQLWAIKERQNA